MKLRNLMYATMIACAFASCSKDDEVINGGETAKGNATLEVKMAVPQTKSLGGDASATDDAISDLTVYVFENGTLQAVSGTTLGKGGSASRLISNLSAGTKQVLVLANCSSKLSPSPVLGTTTLAQLEAATGSITNEVNGSLSMNSQVYEVTLTSNVTNYLGYTETDAASGANLNTQVSLGDKPVYLYRNVAKITLGSVTLSNANASRYPNATLAITKVFILHGATTANIVGDGNAWNNNAYTTTASWTNGIDKTAYDAFVTTASKYDVSKLIKGYTESGIAATAWTNYVLAPVAPVTSLYTLDYTNTTNTGTSNVDQFYAFENHSTDTQTLLVVEGTFTYGPLEKRVSTTRYYTVGIGIDNLQNQGNYNAGTYTLNTLTRTDRGVLRNIQYVVDLTVSGPGYETPFGPRSDENTNLDAQVEVVDFGTVYQNTVIE